MVTNDLLAMSIPDALRSAWADIPGLHDCAEFEDTLSTELARIERADGALGLIAMEVDGIAQLYAQYGNEEVRAALALLIRELVRRVRTSDVIGMGAGQELLVLAPDMTLKEATGFAVRLRRLVAEFLHEGSTPFTASVGVATLRQGESVDSLIERARFTLAQARIAGGNRVVADRENT